MFAEGSLAGLDIFRTFILDLSMLLGLSLLQICLKVFSRQLDRHKLRYFEFQVFAEAVQKVR